MFGLTSGEVGGGGLGLETFGLAGQAVSTYFGMQAQKGQFQAESNVAALEQQKNQLNKTQMELNARRSSTEVLRRNQQSRSLAQTNATASGSQFGSGLSGAYGGIQGTSGNNLLGINQNLSIGEQISTINDSETAQKLQEAKYGSQGATASGAGAAFGGVGSFGKDLVSIASNPSGSLFT